MIVRSITMALFLVSFMGFHVESFAQASASVRYTIVVSEDMVAHDNTRADAHQHACNYRFQQNNLQDEFPSTVSIIMHADFDGKEMMAIVAFETEMSPEQAPLLRDVLQTQIASAATQPDVHTHFSDNDQYLVVMEYN